MKKYNRVKAEIDLTAIRHNMDVLHRNTDGKSAMMGIIKADGYGHGCVRIGQMLESLDYVWGYGVATGDEALELKDAALKKPVLVLGCVFPDQYDDMIEQDVRFNVYTYEMAEAINKRAQTLNKKAYIHIKIDTGMSRLGFSCTQESVERITDICRMDHIIAEGIFTHFCKADETEKAFTQKQINAFDNMIKELADNGIVFALSHASNSAGIIDFGFLRYTLVRSGIAMYGLYPSQEVAVDLVDLHPALSLKSRVIMVKSIEPGAIVSYGGLFKAEHAMRIATIPVGYGDGYPREIDTGRVPVWINGKFYPVVGRVAMDTMMVWLGYKKCTVGTPVEIFGRNLPIEEVARRAGTIPYTLTTMLTQRVRTITQDPQKS